MRMNLSSLWKGLCVAGALMLATASGIAAEEIKIGFVVKQPDEPWFQDEWKFADMAAKEKGFTLVRIGAVDGEQALAALDNLGAQGAQGVIICTPDVKLGPAIVARAEANNLKLFTVDDQLVDGQGTPLADVPHMGISATKIGETVGQAIVDEIKKRGWKMEEVGAIRVSYDQLPTAADRVNGAVSVLTANGFPKANVFNAPQQKTDTEAALNASTTVLNAHPQITKWVAFGSNDEATLGAVRASESANIPASDMIAVGINGGATAINEFKKPDATGFFGSIVISPKLHGYEAAKLMHDWIATGKEPPKLTLTAGALAHRDDYAKVRKELGLE